MSPGTIDGTKYVPIDTQGQAAAARGTGVCVLVPFGIERSRPPTAAFGTRGVSGGTSAVAVVPVTEAWWPTAGEAAATEANQTEFFRRLAATSIKFVWGVGRAFIRIAVVTI